jgi:hypothetical protein
MWNEKKEPYVRTHKPSVFYPYVLDRDSWFILRHDLRSKHLFENKNVIMPSEEDKG